MLQQLLAHKIIVAIRGVSLEQCKKTVQALRDGGIRFVEFTYDQQSQNHSITLKAIEYAASIDEIHVGVGTVLTPHEAKLAYDAGAKYIISPSVNRAVIETTKTLGLLSIPGAFSPTEIIQAHQWGADLIKLFPAVNLGISYIKAIRAPISHIPIMVMGGIDDNNMNEYFQAGAAAIGVGSNIANNKLINEGNFDQITRLAQLYLKKIAEQ
ncbi:MAG: bifunctional 4-hydroxy-2-oxoglutarate aldolase/2-dehydro-3-deoxy-phosphogluconate aldolase [Hungatella sp.]